MTSSMACVWRKAVALAAAAAFLASLFVFSSPAEAKTKRRRVADRIADQIAESDGVPVAQAKHHGGKHRVKKTGHQARKLKGGGHVASHRLRAKGRAARRRENQACAEAFDKAKESAGAMHLRAAQEFFARCAQPACGVTLRRECADLVRQVDAVTPSVIPTVEDASESASSGIEVKMDGELLTASLDGRAIAIDPGEHVFSFVREGEAVATRKLIIEQGQRGQVVAVSLAPPAPSPVRRKVDLAPRKVIERNNQGREDESSGRGVAQRDDDRDEQDREGAAPTLARKGAGVPGRDDEEAQPEEGGRSQWPAYALGAVGILGVGGYGALTLRGRNENDALAQTCKPDCMPASVDHVRKVYLYADISLGIGIAALAASTYLFLRSDGAEEARPRSHASGLSGLTLGPTTAGAGAVATVGGSF